MVVCFMGVEIFVLASSKPMRGRRLMRQENSDGVKKSWSHLFARCVLLSARLMGLMMMVYSREV